jgi:transposase
VIGGVDTHLDVHVAAALDPIGGVLGVESYVATPRSYQCLLQWIHSFGTVTKIGVEGTGAYGAGLARFLRGAGIHVVEVDRPNRQVRRLSNHPHPKNVLTNVGASDGITGAQSARGFPVLSSTSLNARVPRDCG